MRRLRWLAAAVIAMCAFAVYAEEFVFQDIKVYEPDNSSIFTVSAITFENLSSNSELQVDLFIVPQPYQDNRKDKISVYFPEFTLKPGEKKHIQIPNKLFDDIPFAVYLKINGKSYNFHSRYDNRLYDSTLRADIKSNDSAMWHIPISMWPTDSGVLRNAYTIILPDNQPITPELKEALLDYVMAGGKIRFSGEQKGYYRYGLGLMPTNDKNLDAHQNTHIQRLIRAYQPKLSETVLNSVVTVLIIFAICAGPVAIISCRKKRHAIFWVVPAISVLFSGIIAIIALWIDGIQPIIKYATYSIIDETRNKAATVSEFWIKHPMPVQKNISLPPNSNISNLTVYNDNARAVIAPDQSVVIENAITPMQPFYISYINVEPQSSKLELSSIQQNKVAVKNTLGHEIKTLFVRAENGDILYTDSPIQPGDTAELTRLYGNKNISVDMPDKITLTPNNRLLNPLDYMAVIDRPLTSAMPEYDNANIEQTHIVFGLKSSPGGELWK